MAKFNTITVILAITAAMGLEVHQMDVKTAFLNNELDVEIYMEPGGVYSKRPRAPRMQVEEIAIPFEEIRTSVVRCIHISIVHKDFTRHHGDHSYWEIKKKTKRPT